VKNKPNNAQLIIAKVVKTIEKHRMLQKGDRVVLAVSGGPDSMCMLDVFLQLVEEYQYRLQVCHVNHALRGEDSQRDELFVKAFCEAHDIRFSTETVDVRQYSAEKKIGIEESARILRYAYLQRIAGETDKIALAHHRDDQAETILLHMIRGSGIKGLSGIRPMNVNRIRPMIECTRQEIMDYLKEKEIMYCEDSTNDEFHTVRNIIRHRLLPYMEELFGEGINERLCRTGMLCARDDLWIDQITRAEYQLLKKPTGIPCDALAKFDKALASHLIRFLYEDVRGTGKNLTFLQTESLLKLTEKASEGSMIHLSDGYAGSVSDGFFTILRRDGMNNKKVLQNHSPKDHTDLFVPLQIPGVLPVQTFGIEIFTKFVEKPDDIVYNANAYCFPLDRVQKAVFRFRSPGDWIRPNQGSGRKTLRKYLTEKKVPAKEKSKIPVLACGTEVLWIPGIGGSRFPPTDPLSRVVCIGIRSNSR
jgi:tRNA(Ile)-lysidine synthase